MIAQETRILADNCRAHLWPRVLASAPLLTDVDRSRLIFINSTSSVARRCTGPTVRRASRTLRALSLVALLLLSHAPSDALKLSQSASAASGLSERTTHAPDTSRSTLPGEGTSFDGERAFAHVKKLVEMGPRPSGSKELQKARQYIVDQLKGYGLLRVSTDEFRASTPVGERTMANITAELAGESSETIIIASHYETKLFKKFRFVGANDGASSTGAVLELARTLASSVSKSRTKPRFTYWFVFFDGEEAFCQHWDQCSKPDAPDNTYGSRRFVAMLREREELKRVRALILLDMIGYKRLELGRDPLSTQWLVDHIWQTARSLGHEEQFVEREEGIGGDDHVPFLRAGIDSVDIIQLNSYPYWHTPDDTLDKISPQSLKIVGDVVLASLPRIEDHLLQRRPSK